MKIDQDRERQEVLKFVFERRGDGSAPYQLMAQVRALLGLLTTTDLKSPCTGGHFGTIYIGGVRCKYWQNYNYHRAAELGAMSQKVTEGRVDADIKIMFRRHVGVRGAYWF